MKNEEKYLRGFNRARLRSGTQEQQLLLEQLDFIKPAQNVPSACNPQTGKTYLTDGLGLKACLLKMNGICYRTNENNKGSNMRGMKKLIRGPFFKLTKMVYFCIELLVHFSNEINTCKFR